jgi:nickel-dependent lactate racemase
MRVTLHYGLEHVECDVREADLIASPPRAPVTPIEDIAGAVRAALENPVDYPALRRALTPDDHVTIVVDESLPHLVELLGPLLEHIEEARVSLAAITLLCPCSDYRQEWLEDLPDSFQEVRCQVHAPGDRKQLRYLATMKGGRRLYLSGAAVDADQVVVLSGRGYDPRLGYSGAEGSLFPALSDEPTIAETNNRLSLAAPDQATWPLRTEATEAAWLLGAPFFVQAIPGDGDGLAHILAGPAASAHKSEQELDARRRHIYPYAAAKVVATVSGDPTRLRLLDMAAAAASAARVVQSGGRIILLAHGRTDLGPAGEMLRQADTPEEALDLLQKQKPPDMAAAFLWASAARQARIYMLSDFSAEIAEELFAVPLDEVRQAQRLFDEPGTTIILNDSHKTMATTE